MLNCGLSAVSFSSPKEGLKFTQHSTRELCRLIETFLYHADVG